MRGLLPGLEGHYGIFAVLARPLRLSADDIVTPPPPPIHTHTHTQDELADIFADDSFRWIFVKEKFRIWIENH